MKETVVDPEFVDGGFRCPPGYVMGVDGKCYLTETTDFGDKTGDNQVGGTESGGTGGDSGTAGGDAGDASGDAGSGANG